MSDSAAALLAVSRFTLHLWIDNECSQGKLTMMSLGQYLRKLRDERDLSLREFAKKVDCSAAFISDVELGRRYPSDELLASMAKVLGTTVEELKKHDTRPPTEEMKRLIATDPRYALAFRTVMSMSPEALMKLAKRHENTSKKK